jgi:hypothetical protein
VIACTTVILHVIQNLTKKAGNMKRVLQNLPLQLTLAMLLPGLTAAALDTPNPAMEKFQQDMKTAVLNGSITVAQVKQLQADAEVLKSAKSEQEPGAPVDLLTPYRAVSSMKTTMASVDAKDRETLHNDLQAVLANKAQPTASADPPNPGKKLGKDIFKAVMFGNPTEAQVKQLQDSLNELQDIKGKQERPLQALRALQGSKSQIESVMNAGSFRQQDRQAVLDDLNSLGPQGGGMRR